jgi:hypothetical protein
VIHLKLADDFLVERNRTKFWLHCDHVGIDIGNINKTHYLNWENPWLQKCSNVESFLYKISFFLSRPESNTCGDDLGIHENPMFPSLSRYLLQQKLHWACDFFSIYSTVYLASPNKKFCRIQTQKLYRYRPLHSHRTHNTTHTNKMNCCLPTPSGFALYLHCNICHGPKSWCRGSPRVCCRRLAVGLLLLLLVPLVGTPN